jgi:hypothetical protein
MSKMKKNNKLNIPIDSKIPKFSESILSNESIIQLQEVAKQVSSIISSQQNVLLGLQPQLIGLSKIIEEQQKYRIDSFQSIAQQLQPLIGSQSLFTSDFYKISKQASESLKALKTIGIFNAFENYRESFYEFGGDLNPENFTEEDIEKTFQENQEIISEVKEVIIKAERDNYSPDDTMDLIYTLFLHRIPFLDKKKYSIMIFIFVFLHFSYNLHSTYSTNNTLDNVVVPGIKETLEKTNENSFDLKDNNRLIEKQSVDIKKTNEEIKNTNKLISNIREEFNEYKTENNEKLESILIEMRKQNNKKDK